MYKNLKEAFSTNLNITITQSTINQLERYCQQWELHKDHPLMLNGVYIAIHKISFLEDTDGQYLLNMFNTNLKEVYSLIKQTTEIDISQRVATNPYNLFVLWVYYKILHSNVSAKNKELGCFNLLKMLQYKFLSGRIRAHFPYPPDQATMDYTLNELDNKFDIVRYGTWKRVVEAATRVFMDNKSIHAKTLSTFSTDKDIRYVLTDVYRKISSRIQIIASSFYLNKEHDNVIKSSKLVTEFEGDKIIKTITGLENLLTSIHTQIISTTAFIDQSDVDITVSINKKISAEMLQTTLMRFSDTALQQTRTDKYDAVKKIKGQEVIINVRMLVNELLLVIYNTCIIEKVKRAPLPIIEKALNLMQSSQVKDERILTIKRSLDHFIISLKVSTRDATIVSLRLALVVYLLLRSFKYLPK